MKNGGLRYSNASKDEEGKGISPIGREDGGEGNDFGPCLIVAFRALDSN